MSQSAAFLLVACQWAIAITFARAAFGKLVGDAAFAGFRRWLVDAARVPQRVAGPVAVATVVAEGAVAVAVLVPVLAPAGFAVAALMLAAFTAAVARMWQRRVAVPCRCFGAGRHPPGPLHVARNAALLLVAATGVLLALAGAAGRPVDAAGVLAGALLALLLGELEEIVAVIRPVTVDDGRANV